jgi:sugar/nucleoside kinase (ribokinase family)
MSYLTIVGHINVDFIFEVGEIPKFGSEEIRTFRRELGGTGANIAMNAAKLGTPVTLISRISEKFPEEFIRKLRESGIDLILERDKADGPFCYIADAGNRQIAFMLQGPMNTAGSDYKIESKYCHFATSNPDWILTLMDSCRGVRVFDPGQEIKYRWTREKLAAAVEKADLLFLNEDEFNYITSFHSIDKKKAIVTLGSRGAMFAGEIIETVPVLGHSTLGAGDMFRAAFYSALYIGKDTRTAIMCANRITSLYLKMDRSSADLSKWKELCRDNYAGRVQNAVS